MSDKIELRRSILITAYNNPNATQAQIATACDCPHSDVSAVLQQYDGPEAMKTQIQEYNRALELNPSAGLDRTRSRQASPNNKSEVSAILTGDRNQQSEAVRDTGLDSFVEESVRGFLYLLPWTETVDDEMTLGEAIFWTGVFFLLVGVVVWAMWFANV